MSAGTLSLTNGSTSVTGTNTAFQTDLAQNDFIVCKIGGATYTLGVATIGSNTALTLTQPFTGPTTSGVAWYAVPNQTLVGITTELSANLTSVYRSVLVNDANWTKVFSASGNITVTLKDGSTYTGPSWRYMSDQFAGKMDKSQNLNDVADKTTAWNNIARYGSSSTTAARGDDYRLNSIEGKLGGTINGGLVTTGAITGPPTGGLAVGAGENNRVELNNVGSGGSTGTPVGWTVYRWYNELVQTGIRRAGDTTIQAYFMALSNVGSWEFQRSGNASAPGSWINGSDQRHKSNITLVKDPLASVLAWRGSTYDKKDGQPEVGLIAQDVQRACAVAISTNGDRKFMDGTVIPDFKYLNTAGVAAAYHTEAIKAIVEIMYQLAEDPAEAIKTLDAITKKSEAIKAIKIEEKDPWKDSPPVWDVPTNQGLLATDSETPAVDETS